MNASCIEKTNGYTDIDSESFNVSFGNITIHESTLNLNYNDYVFSVYPTENITIALYLKDVTDQSISTSDGDIYYTVRDITTGDVVTINTITYALKKMNEQESIWIENFTIPLTAPVGIIDFSAKDTTTNDFGGNFVYYQAISMKQKLTINETDIDMGDSVFINLTNIIYYGDLEEVNTAIEYPNGSEKNITLNAGNNYDSVFKTPTTQQGIYNVSISLKHKSGYTNFISKTFSVREYSIDTAKLKAVYSPGETVEISAALLDYNKNPVSSKINFTFYDLDDAVLHKYLNEDTSIENNYRDVTYKLSNDAENGTYIIAINIIDDYNITYKINETFSVGDPLQYTDVDFSKEVFTINITNLNTIKKRINITNRGSKITDINISINDTNYTSINTTTIDESLEKDDKTYFYFEIQPKDDMPKGELTSMIKINISE
ncbi:MAG: hypothetical protein KAS12_03330, partial [Candidatus Aenigmarchaeota archaeon]|nr:hypothetical protein [Candidatus Aenigmarchaeota archaeon]